MKFVIMVAALALSTSMAFAGNKAAADACAATLQPGPKAVYDAVAPEVKPDSVMKDLLVSKLKPMVMSGQLSMATAKADAKTAMNCLTVLK